MINWLLYALAILSLILIPLAPALLRLRIRFFRIAHFRFKIRHPFVEIRFHQVRVDGVDKPPFFLTMHHDEKIVRFRIMIKKAPDFGF